MPSHRPHIFLALMFMQFACQNKQAQDVRMTVIGDYVFTVYFEHVDASNNLISDSIKTYNGNIALSPSNKENVIICYLPNTCLEAVFGSNGELQKTFGSGLGYGFSGNFVNPKITFTYQIPNHLQNVVGVKKQ